MNDPTSPIRLLTIQANPPGIQRLDGDVELRKLEAALSAGLARKVAPI